MDPLAKQPALFSPEEIADLESSLPDAVDRPSTPEYTGAIIEKRTALVAAVIQALAEGQSERATAAAYGLNRRTVAGIRERAETAGKLAPFKKRLSSKLSRAVEIGVETWIEGVEAGQVRPDQIPVAVGIFSDKKAAIDGEAGLVVEHRHTVDLDAWRERLAAARQAAAAVVVSTEATLPALDAEVVESEEPAQQSK